MPAMLKTGIVLALLCLAPAALAQEQPPTPPQPAPTTSSEDDEAKKDQQRRDSERAASTQRGSVIPVQEKQAVSTQPDAAGQKAPLDDSVEAKKAIFISGDVGFTRSDLGLLSDKTGFDKTAANGVMYGVAAGVRLSDLRLGLRWRIHDTTESALWNFAASIGYGLKTRPISPVFSLYVGYVFDQKLQEGLYRSSIPAGAPIGPNVDVKGMNVGLDVNASYWVTKFLRVGAFIGADLLVLSRERAATPESIFGATPETRDNKLYTDSGSGVGLNMNAGIRGAFDIGFQ